MDDSRATAFVSFCKYRNHKNVRYSIIRVQQKINWPDRNGSKFLNMSFHAKMSRLY